MSSQSDNSDSSLDSHDHLYLGTMEDFHIKRGRVRAINARDGRTGKTVLARLSKLHGSKEHDWRVRTLERFRVRQTARNWTKFFLSEDIVLQGYYECSNLLRASPCISVNPIVIQADSFFPYCSDQDRRVNGYIVDQVRDAKNVTIVHLSNRTSRQLTLQAGEVYLVGGRYGPKPYCHVCLMSHDLSVSPCASALRFMPLPSHAHFKNQIWDEERPGARILTLIPGQPSTLTDCSLDEEVCKDCHSKAVRDGTLWLKMNGTCPDKHCPNYEWCECVEENERDSGLCAHYIYVREGKFNNLADDTLATAVATSVIKVVNGCVQPFQQKSISRTLRGIAKKWLKQGKKVTVEELLEEYVKEYGGSRMLKCEVMALAMSDVRLADIIDGYNSYTLNKINGFVENTEIMKVGPWLSGRLAKDWDGIWWQTGHREPVLVSTEGDVSTVQKASMTSMWESDDLGKRIA